MPLQLQEEIDSWVSEILEKHRFQKIQAPKIIRDAVVGPHRFPPIDVSLIDTPFMQRLRRIHQTALAYLVYPSATHTRFEHSLGTAIIGTNIARALQEKFPDVMQPKIIDEIRIAGLLHDIGHGPFSHASEDIIKELPEVKEALREEKGKFNPNKVHEMISYFIIRSRAFITFFEEHLCKEYKQTAIDIRDIASIVIGKMPDPHKQGFISDIINGAFDADKLDYIIRDSYFTGVKIAIDIQRLPFVLSIDIRPDKAQRIIGDIKGVSILEQILFGKMLLTPSIYHHHKNRAASCMLKSIFERINHYGINIEGLNFKKATDFLRADDVLLLSPKNKPIKLLGIIERINKRELLKRALVICRATLKKDEDYEELLRLTNFPSKILELRQLIAKSLLARGKRCSVHDIWVDLPPPPRFPEPTEFTIQITNRDFLKLTDLFKLTQWSHSFAINKWRGYVFCPPNLQEETDKSAREVFQDVLGIRFNKDASTLAKYDD